jgi:MFS transporter
MAASASCNALPLRGSLSNASSTIFATLAAITFSASGAVPTPLFHQYQEDFGLTPALLTIIFAAYVLCLLLALLTTGSLSDHVGRRPVILVALAMNVVAMVMFITAGSAAALIAARSVQGFATGVGTTALGAAILDTDKIRGPMLNSMTAFAGLTAGSLGAGVLVAFAPDPTQLVYVVLLALSAIEMALLWRMPRTVEPKPGALASLRPHVGVPAQAHRALAQLTPVTIASWALGGFYFSLMPSLIRAATGITSPATGGLVVAALTFTAAAAVLLLRAAPAERVLLGGIPALAIGVAITLTGIPTQSVALMLLGTVVSGIGFGTAFSGTIRTVMRLAKANERAALLSAFYVVGYLAFSLPAVIAGVVAPTIGLTTAAEIYGFLVIFLAIASLLVMTLTARS